MDLSVNAVQGGSLRLLLRKTGSGAISNAAQTFLDDERQSILYDEPFLAGWRENIARRMAAFSDALHEYARRGATIVAYGAPTKATLLMKMAGLDGKDIALVVEDNPHKAGRFLPATAIPIRPTAALDDARPDVIVLLAWNFASDIIARLRGRFDRPVEIVVPLPELRIETL